MKYYTTMTDNFMSGWGEASGKINKYVIECDTYAQAMTAKCNAHKRREMSYINIRTTKPYYNKSHYHTSTEHFNDLGAIWTE